MLKEQLLGFAIKTISHAHETKERIKNSLPGQIIQTYITNIKENSRLWKQPRDQVKKNRKSSIRPAKEIDSVRAEKILQMIRQHKVRLVDKNEDIDGKKSLAYLVWALGHAEEAGLHQGISVHDVSSLLYQACNIELYPINISRVVYGNGALVRQAGHEKRTKTYLLTSDGRSIFKEKFL